jgi:tRNA pseudouridine55 synthase
VSAKRGQTDLSGILLVDKPSGMTSHDVVDRVRRATRERRVGHAGTLDPMATGLLVVLVGPAARLAPYLTAAEKTYEARIVFGFETDTDDAEGRVTDSAAVPGEISDPFFAAGTVAALVGTHEQLPPAYSAIKQGGKVAHEAARAGDPLVLEPRTIEIASARLLGVECAGEYAWDIECSVSKGTYIRALARDLGRALNTAAHLGALRRTRSGGASVDQARSLEEIESVTDIAALFCDPITALGLPVVEVSEETAERVLHGTAIGAASYDVRGLSPDATVSVAREGVLLGVYARSGEQLRPQAIIPGGVRGAA